MIKEVLQELAGQLGDVLPRLLDMAQLGGPPTDDEAQNKTSAELAGHQVDLPRPGDLFQQGFVQLIRTLGATHSQRGG